MVAKSRVVYLEYQYVFHKDYPWVGHLLIKGTNETLCSRRLELSDWETKPYYWAAPADPCSLCTQRQAREVGRVQLRAWKKAAAQW